MGLEAQGDNLHQGGCDAYKAIPIRKLNGMIYFYFVPQSSPLIGLYEMPGGRLYPLTASTYDGARVTPENVENAAEKVRKANEEGGEE